MIDRLPARAHSVLRAISEGEERTLNCGDARTAKTLTQRGLLTQVNERWDTTVSYRLTERGTAYVTQHLIPKG